MPFDFTKPPATHIEAERRLPPQRNTLADTADESGSERQGVLNALLLALVVLVVGWLAVRYILGRRERYVQPPRESTGSGLWLQKNRCGTRV